MFPSNRLCKMLAVLLVYEHVFKVLELSVSCFTLNSLLFDTLNSLCLTSFLGEL